MSPPEIAKDSLGTQGRALCCALCIRDIVGESNMVGTETQSHKFLEFRRERIKVGWTVLVERMLVAALNESCFDAMKIVSVLEKLSLYSELTARVNRIRAARAIFRVVKGGIRLSLTLACHIANVV